MVSWFDKMERVAFGFNIEWLERADSTGRKSFDQSLHGVNSDLNKSPHEYCSRSFTYEYWRLRTIFAYILVLSTLVFIPYKLDIMFFFEYLNYPVLNCNFYTLAWIFFDIQIWYDIIDFDVLLFFLAILSSREKFDKPCLDQNKSDRKYLA